MRFLKVIESTLAGIRNKPVTQDSMKEVFEPVLVSQLGWDKAESLNIYRGKNSSISFYPEEVQIYNRATKESFIVPYSEISFVYIETEGRFTYFVVHTKTGISIEVVIG